MIAFFLVCVNEPEQYTHCVFPLWQREGIMNNQAASALIFSSASVANLTAHCSDNSGVLTIFYSEFSDLLALRQRLSDNCQKRNGSIISPPRVIQNISKNVVDSGLSTETGS